MILGLTIDKEAFTGDMLVLKKRFFFLQKRNVKINRRSRTAFASGKQTEENISKLHSNVKLDISSEATRGL